MKSTFKKVLIWLLIGFFGLFAVRFAWETANRHKTLDQVGMIQEEMNMQTVDAVPVGMYQGDSSNAMGKAKLIQNIATVTMTLPAGAKWGKTAQTVVQKYEKIASIFTETSRFDADEKKVRGVINLHKAIIQYERNEGLKGDRVLTLTIGVQPDSYDQTVQALRKIGKVKTINVTKHDRTQQYKELQAKKDSLEETKNALISLKQKGGKIEEFIALEERIMELDAEARNLGVDLGGYDSGADLNTIDLTLREVKAKSAPSALKITTAALLSAFSWTAWNYLAFLGVLFMAALLTLLIVSLLQRFKGLHALLKGVGLTDESQKSEAE